jgi:hypothetical protein
MASPAPVFPEVASMIVPPGPSMPRRSASRMMFNPTRSFMDPAGFMNSIFA